MAPVRQVFSGGDAAVLSPRLAIQPELTDGDVTWLNDQLALVGRPLARYARELPPPPPPSGMRPPPDTSWIAMTRN